MKLKKIAAYGGGFAVIWATATAFYITCGVNSAFEESVVSPLKALGFSVEHTPIGVKHIEQSGHVDTLSLTKGDVVIDLSAVVFSNQSIAWSSVVVSQIGDDGGSVFEADGGQINKPSAHEASFSQSGITVNPEISSSFDSSIDATGGYSLASKGGDATLRFEVPEMGVIAATLNVLDSSLLDVSSSAALQKMHSSSRLASVDLSFINKGGFESLTRQASEKQHIDPSQASELMAITVSQSNFGPAVRDPLTRFIQNPQSIGVSVFPSSEKATLDDLLSILVSGAPAAGSLQMFFSNYDINVVANVKSL